MGALLRSKAEEALIEGTIVYPPGRSWHSDYNLLGFMRPAKLILFKVLCTVYCLSFCLVLWGDDEEDCPPNEKKNSCGGTEKGCALYGLLAVMQ